MNGKGVIFCVLLALLSVKVFPQAMTLDEAIKTTASELGQRIIANRIGQTAEEIRRQLTAQTKIAVLNFSSDRRELSAYVIDELNNSIVREGSLTVVDRQQLDLVRQEQNFQISGDVDDKSAQSIGKFLGAQSVLSGSLVEIGKTYRFRVRVIAVETGVVQYSNSIDIKTDAILTALMPKVKTDYNFGEKLGIGLLNITFGAGSFIIDDGWGPIILGIEFAGALGGSLFGGLLYGSLNYREGDWAGKYYFIGAGFGFIPGALLGLFRGFLAEYPRSRTAQAFPVDINIVPVSSNNLGVQAVYKLSF